MWPVTADWLAALTRSHGITVTVDAIRAGVHLGRVPFETARVRVAGGNRVRRTLELVTAEELYPVDADDLLSPFGTELLVSYAVTGTDGQAIGPPVPVFLGGIDEPSRVLRSGKLPVRASDRFADINAGRFLAPRVGPAGMLIPAAIRSLLMEVIPEAGVIDATGSRVPVTSGVMWTRDRGAAVDELATAIGAEVAALPDGSFLIRIVPTVQDPPAWFLSTGPGGVIADEAAAVSRDGVRNAWVVTGERVDGTTAVLATVYDNDPASPTRWNGPLRQRPGFWSSPLVTSPEQGLQAARGRLARSLGLARQRRITCAPNPALDVGDVVAITVDGATEAHVVDDIDLGLSPESAAMTFTSRSTTLAEE